MRVVLRGQVHLQRRAQHRYVLEFPKHQGSVFRDTHLVVAVSAEVARPDVHGDEFPVTVEVHLLHGREEETSEPRLQTARAQTR